MNIAVPGSGNGSCTVAFDNDKKRSHRNASAERQRLVAQAPQGRAKESRTLGLRESMCVPSVIRITTREATLCDW